MSHSSQYHSEYFPPPASLILPLLTPKVDFWEIDAGNGARLEGKPPIFLKEKEGKQINARKLRADVAAKRGTEKALVFPLVEDMSKPIETKQRSRITVSLHKDQGDLKRRGYCYLTSLLLL